MTPIMTNPFFATATLYVVATPLGNLGDISMRAADCLRAADAIGCEDTRHARRLLDHLGVKAPTFALHEHNEVEATAKLLALLGDDKRVALISDAGTPGISDPGARTVAAVRAAGFAVVPLPGPSAAIAALSVSGLSDAHFLFVGFLPVKETARRSTIATFRDTPAALVVYEAPHRIVETVADLVAELQPERTLLIAREITKMFEQIVSLPLPEAPAWLAADANHCRGEFVLVVSAPQPKPGLATADERTLQLLLAELPLKQAVKLAAEISGAPKNALYERALAMRDEPL
jgi:16S rRNA (cytidine1402-2'-O)-methyltransferase